MFGYVTVCEPELKMKDFRKYKAYYCGLCRVLKEKYGFSGQMTLTYDMTFAIILLTSLYESETREEQHRCKIHPVKKQMMLRNEITEYAADMNVLLAYYHMKDDWIDEKKVSGFVGTGMLKRKAGKIISKYPRQSRAIRRSLSELSKCEKENSMDLDKTAGCFGKLMEEFFVYKKDVWEQTLRRLGFFLGKFIYIMDAYDDLDSDLKKNCYNPLRKIWQQKDYEEQIRTLLCMMIAECSAEFEKLPCLLDVDILRNILYDGVWNRYKAIQKKKKEGKEQNDVKKSL
nr:DUF5685 family protein [uncultured Sellimonas sp.]